jgi:uncharacterized protein YoxC
MSAIFFLIIAISLVIIFYQFGKVVEVLTPAIESQSKITEALTRYCIGNSTEFFGGNTGVVPVV